MSELRINKFLSSAGVGSRREIDLLIDEGIITVNGEAARVGQRVDPDKDIIKVRDELINKIEEKVYYLLNKPTEVLCILRDKSKRKIVTELIDDKRRMFPVGILDYQTEGLIILTNDGDLINKIMHSKSEIREIYFVKIKGELTDEKIKLIESAINLEAGKTVPTKIEEVKIENGFSNFEISIIEVKNRQIRRMCDTIDNDILELKRLSMGEINIEGLNVGEYRELTKSEIEYLKNL